MATVSLLVGQCGNQLGTKFLDTLFTSLDKDNAVECKTSTFFDDEDGHVPSARAIRIDMEKKAIIHAEQEVKRGGKWKFPRALKFSKRSGSGNNWAQGYVGYSTTDKDSLHDILQRQVEKCDMLDGFLMISGLAGGTGSGLGVAISEQVRDEYQHASLMHQTVWPYSSGEVIVQDYNAVLTLSHLYELSDGIAILENDQLHRICNHRLGIENVGINEINTVAAHILSSVWKPVSKDMPLHRLVVDIPYYLCSHPAFKLFQFKTAPIIRPTSLSHTVTAWPGLLKRIYQMLITNTVVDEEIDWSTTLSASFPPEDHAHKPVKTLQNMLILRGKDVHQVDTSTLADPRLYVQQSSSPRLHVLRDRRTFLGYDKCATLLSNSQGSINGLDNIVRRSWRMFTSHAYLHQYETYGVTRDDFEASFLQLEQVMHDYRKLSET
ncbi:tubulin delta chain-like [Corticium candelabrum]|uniref:tubulin delta chain-like n=1 Tax=Corticium candelabrum TaxID=121492 RepID=UPI002E27700A|nr:tubulin delta chain-like [Corticium candelabrum]